MSLSYTRLTPLFASNGFSSSSSTGNHVSSGSTTTLYNQRSGERVTGWRTRIKAGQSATSAYTATQYRVTIHNSPLGMGSIWGIKDGLGLNQDLIVTDHGTGCLPTLPSEGLLTHLDIDSATTDAEALAKLYERIKAVRSQMNGLQFLGELREAIHMIRHPADAFLKGLRSYHDALKTRVRGVTRYVPIDKRKRIITDVIATTWLEYSYGWKPLLNDVKDIAETAARMALKTPPRERVTAAKESATRTQPNIVQQNVGWYGRIGVLMRTQRITTYGNRWTVGLASSVVAPTDSLARIAELSGFTLENFIPTIWELIPLSFVAEYFSNIGDIIEASCMSDAGITWLSNTTRFKTSYYQTTSSNTAAPLLTLPEYWIGAVGTDLGSIVSEITSIVRSVPSSLPIPNLRLTIPGSANKYANLGALVLVLSRDSSKAFSGKLRGSG